MSTEGVVNLISSSYVSLVKHLVAGPLSFSWFFPFFLLPIALLIPPKTLSHSQLIYFFLVPITASVIHAWIAMRGVDVVSVDILCWSIFLIGANDPRVDFRRVEYPYSTDLANQVTGPLEQDTSAEGVRVNNEEKNGHVEANGRLYVMDEKVMDADHGTFESLNNRETKLGPKKILDDEPYPDDLLPRVRWILHLIPSVRLVRWKTGSSRHDSKQNKIHPTRLEYILSLIPVILLALLTICVTTLLANHDPYFRNATTIPIASAYPTSSTAKPLTVSFLQNLLPPFILRPLTLGFYTWALLTFGFNPIVLLPIYTNYLFGFPNDNWSPHTLPPYFESFTSVLDGGLRRAWGTWWHQFMRFMVIGPGLVVVKALGLHNTSATARTITYSSAFFFSGIAHMGLVPPEPMFAKGGTTAMVLRLRIAAFFWVQPVGCLIEVFLEKAVKRVIGDQTYFSHGVGKLIKRMVVAIWVFSWLSLTLRLPTVPFSELRYWDLVALPIFPVALQDFLMGKWLP